MIGRFTCSAAAVTTVLVLAGCVPAQRVNLSGQWPAQPGSYTAVDEAWTRHATLRTGLSDQFEEVLDVYATLESPDWRAAYVSHRGRRELLSAQALRALAQAQQQEAAKYHEVELLVATHRRDENDLDDGKRSVWRLRLVNSKAAEVAPVSIVRDRRPRQVIRADFPQLGDFAKAYIVKFPAKLQIFGDGADWVALKLASSRGGVKMVWKGRN